MASFLKITLLATALSLGSGAVCAQGVYGYEGFGAPQGYPGDYGYAGSAIRGDYVGAPLTRFPRPSELVPSAWGYGTYGIPTVSGIRQAPVGTPTVYVIDAPGAASASGSGSARPRILTRGRDGRLHQAREFRGQGFRDRDAQNGDPHPRMALQSGSRVITVSVPR